MLMSRANKNEFPGNKANRFKKKLFHSLILREPGWRVGLSSISLPVALPDLRALSDSFEGKWMLQFSFFANKLLGDGKRSYLTEEVVEFDPMVLNNPGNVRTDFMKTFADSYNQAIPLDVSKGDKLASSDGKKHYLDIQWEGEGMVINNEHVFQTAKRGRLLIKIKKKLALQMKWFVKGNMTEGNKIKMGPNLIMSLYENTGPDVLDVVDEVNDQMIFWKEKSNRLDGEFIQLSVFANWRFINLNKTGLELGLVNDLVIRASEFEKDSTITDGVSLMVTLVNRYDRKCLSQVVQGSDLQDVSGKNMFITFKWTDRDGLLIDNSNTSLELSANSIRPAISLGLKLAQKMGWIVEEYDKNRTKTVKLVPNLKQEFGSSAIPTPLNLRGNDGEHVFWRSDGSTVDLSVL